MVTMRDVLDQWAKAPPRQPRGDPRNRIWARHVARWHRCLLLLAQQEGWSEEEMYEKWNQALMEARGATPSLA